MFGDNPKRGPETGDGSVLQVVNLFPTLQGEGPHVGWPAVFVRLGGCNLACKFCDTEFEAFQPWPLEKLVAEVGQLAMGDGKRVRHLVVITGGEPFRQPIGPLCEALQGKGFTVQIESNGTLWRPLPEGVEVVCSPKNSSGMIYAPVHGDLLPRVTAFKFLLSTRVTGYAQVPELGQTEFRIPVYVQPMDEYEPEQNAENLRFATEVAMENGYRLSLQTHKIAGIA